MRRDIPIGDTRNHGIECRSLHHTWRANRAVGHAQRHRAVRTTAIVEEQQSRPARRAKPIICLDNAATSRTAWRQDKVDDGADGGAKHRARLSSGPGIGTSANMDVPEIFDRSARRSRRIRGSADNFFTDLMVDDLLERLDDRTDTVADAIVIGAVPRLVSGLQKRGTEIFVTDVVVRPGVDAIAEEDRLDLGNRKADLVISVGALDTVSDLPGALILMRRALRPGGLLLAAFFGGPSLSAMRSIITTADAATGRSAARLHPQVDVRGGGDLLTRSGFVQPVADLQELRLRYTQFDRGVADLRECGATNCLTARHPVSMSWLAAAREAFECACAGDTGALIETVSYITLTGTNPANAAS